MRGKSSFFFLAASYGALAFFILSSAGVAKAYAIPSTGTPIGGAQPYQQSTASGFGGTYNAGNSLQNLISPFQNFIKSLSWNTSTMAGITPTNNTLPTLNIPPGAQNIFTQLDNSFYNLTGIRLSVIASDVLNALAWALTFVIAAVDNIINWATGLIR